MLKSLLSFADTKQLLETFARKVSLNAGSILELPGEL